jgi:hypothetical protein
LKKISKFFEPQKLNCLFQRSQQHLDITFCNSLQNSSLNFKLSKSSCFFRLSML